MNKYQEFLLKGLNISTELAEEKNTNKGAKNFLFKDYAITITQNDNYFLNIYKLYISHPAINEIWIYKNNNKILGKMNEKSIWEIELDFNDKSDKLIISFKDDITAPIEIPIFYIDANKELWDEKIRKEKRDELAKKVNIIISYGNSFINVLFKPINEKFSYSKVTLYYLNQDYRNPYKQIMGDFKSEENKFYISIMNLGYSDYEIILKQYDKENILLYESDAIEFKIIKIEGNDFRLLRGIN